MPKDAVVIWTCSFPERTKGGPARFVQALYEAEHTRLLLSWKIENLALLVTEFVLCSKNPKMEIEDSRPNHDICYESELPLLPLFSGQTGSTIP